MSASRLSGRQSDDLTLRAVRLRAAGMTTKAIGDRLGLASGNVVLRTNAVRDADLDTAATDADRRAIARAYW